VQSPVEVITTGADSRGTKTAGAAPFLAAPVSDEEFAELVDALVADPNRHDQLTDLLRENHPWYNERGTATIAQMRGWALLGLARTGVSDHALLFVLEELDTGIDPYLVAAAACALRSYAKPNPALAPFVMRALSQNRYRDDPVSFLAYADYSLGPETTSPVLELLLTLAWLGPCARSVLPELESTVKSGGLSKKALAEAHRTLESIRGSKQIEEEPDCCKLPDGLISKFSWAGKARRSSEPIAATVFEDQDGAEITFNEFFQGRPSIVVFFYTRCDNPLKCSLTVTKLARVQKLLESRNLAEQIQTAAITYDPSFDVAERIRRYGEKRSVRQDTFHRMLRATNGIDSLRQHFKLGVNFVESLVNRHRLEVYVLDRNGRVAASFERLHWDEQEVVDRTIELLAERKKPARIATPMMGTLASVAIAFFPKCPVCWAAYLSMLGVTGVIQVPYSPWLQPILAVLMIANVASVWWRGRATGRMIGPCLVTLGALVILASRFNSGSVKLAALGIVLTLAGSLLGVVSSVSLRSLFPALRRS
jgi:protein SCO1